MDYSTLVQALVAAGDIVISTVECSLFGAFRILALVEHRNWKNEETANNHDPAQNNSPESREFVILVMDGRAPILIPDNLHVTNLIPVVANVFSCDIDTENGADESEFCVKITTSLTDPVIYVKLARGHRSQNFIDEVFRAAQSSSTIELQGLSWLSFYEELKSDSNPYTCMDTAETIVDSASQDFKNDVDEEDVEDYEVVAGVDRESMAKGMTSLKGRDTIIKCVLDSKQDQFVDLVGYKVLVGTWNVNGQSPGSICLSDWLSRTPEPPDFYAVAFQELDLSKEAFLFNETPKEAEWLTRVKEGLHKGAVYKKVKLVRLVGMMLIVYCKDNLFKRLKQVQAEYVGTGILGKMGNKGGVAVRFDMDETSICFVNCHLAAHVEEFQRRNTDFQQICARLTFYLPQGTTYIKDHDLVFWFGDMNYRINPQSMDPMEAKKLIEQERYFKMLECDQLKDQMREGNVFVNYKEGQISFKPTYKYDPGTDNWDSSEKNRSPAWCDRILWRDGDGNVKQLDYTSLNAYTLSDHKPVSSLFTANVKVINWTKYRRVYEAALKEMDKNENEFLPQVTVDIPGANLAAHSNRNEIHFGLVKFMEPVRKTFTVANTGQVPVHLEFIKKLDDLHVCKHWLRIEPRSAFIQPGETCEIELQVLVDKKSAGSLNIGKDNLYDILVLHLDGGKDIFVTVIGDYERCIFGCSISALVNMLEPISAISPGKLIELEKGVMPMMGTYDIPKELWFLVDRLWRVGMKKESLFTQAGVKEEVLEIRDWLSVIPNKAIPGSVDSIAEALFLLLESFPEPVIPFSLHLKCLDAASSYTSCKQVIKLLPPAHRNVFVYICSFLRELLVNADKNGLEPKLLALWFGRIMLREQNWNSKLNQRADKDKATFIYQFLVNEDYGEDL